MFTNIHSRLYAALVASFCVLGVCLTFAQPVFSLPDEGAHWLTANVRIERFLGKSGCVPTIFTPPCPRKRICSSIPRFELTCTDDIGVYGDMLTYPGVLLAKLILPRQTESAVRQVQGIVLSRLLQGLLAVICLLRIAVLARRTRRIGGLTLGALMLSPLLAQQAFGVSADGVQLGLGLCLFSAILFWEALTPLDVALFVILGYPSTAKPTMFMLMLPSVFAACWFTQVERPEVQRVREIARGLVQTLKLTRRPSPQTLLMWCALALSALTVIFALHQDAVGQAATAAADNIAREAHLQELREHPLRAFELITQLRYDPREAAHWVGPLGWLDTRLSAAVVHGFQRIFFLMLGLELGYLVLLAARQRAARLGARGRLLRALPGLLLGLLGPLVNVLFMTALMYVLWTPLEDHVARGVQMRYFFPASMVAIALGWRWLGLLLPLAQVAETTRAAPLRRWLAVAAPALVLALSLPFIARLFVDLSIRYHNPAKYEPYEP